MLTELAVSSPRPCWRLTTVGEACKRCPHRRAGDLTGTAPGHCTFPFDFYLIAQVLSYWGSRMGLVTYLITSMDGVAPSSSTVPHWSEARRLVRPGNHSAVLWRCSRDSASFALHRIEPPCSFLPQIFIKKNFKPTDKSRLVYWINTIYFRLGLTSNILPHSLSLSLS